MTDDPDTPTMSLAEVHAMLQRPVLSRRVVETPDGKFTLRTSGTKSQGLAAVVLALQPFAEIAELHVADAPEWGDDDTVSAVIRIGDLRRALAAINAIKGN